MGDNIEQALLSPQQAGRYLGVSLSTVFRMARKGKVPQTQVRRALRFRKADLDGYVQARLAAEWQPRERGNRSPDLAAQASFHYFLQRDGVNSCAIMVLGRDEIRGWCNRFAAGTSLPIGSRTGAKVPKNMLTCRITLITV